MNIKESVGMKVIKIGYDKFQKKDIIKLEYGKDLIPKQQFFNKDDVIVGHPGSNIAIGFVYIWKEDKAPENIREFFKRVSNYAALTGYWKTTNGARYVFSNILANPNINKLIIFVFSSNDNGHLLVDALTNFWKNGINQNGIIIGSNAANPKFEQLSVEALLRAKKQCDLVVLRKISPDKEGFDIAEKLVKAMYQEPDNAVNTDDFNGIEFYSTDSDVIKRKMFYDSGARFTEPYLINLDSAAKKVEFKKKDLSKTLGQSVQAENLEDALEIITSFVYEHGEWTKDQRGITTIESRSFTITIMNALAKIPDGFSNEYIKKYVDEFMKGKVKDITTNAANATNNKTSDKTNDKINNKTNDKTSDEFAYTYHERIFQHWGNQAERLTNALKKNPNTRRAMISLWDPAIDTGNSNPPCLDFIWAVIRGGQLEFHVVYRSHHLATVTQKGGLMKGEGAFVPNLYAIATLQEDIAKKLGVKRGPIALTDFSGHLYVSGV